MDIDEALSQLDGGTFRVYDTPVGTKLSIKSPSGADWHFTSTERDAINVISDEYEDIVIEAFEMSEEDMDEDILFDTIGKVLAAEDETAAEVIGRCENIPLTIQEAESARAEHL